MKKKAGKNIYIHFLLHVLPILVIPLCLLLGAYVQNQKLFRQEVYDKNISILENSARMCESMIKSVESILSYLDESTSVNNFLSYPSLNVDGTKTNNVIQLQKDIRSIVSANDSIQNIQIFSRKNSMLLDKAQIVVNLNRYYGHTFSIENMDFDKWYQDMLLKNHDWKHRLQIVDVKEKGTASKMFFLGSDIPGHSGEYSKGCVYILLKYDNFFQYFDRLNYQQNGFVYLQDHSGNVICGQNHTGSDQIYLTAEETLGNRGFLTKKVGNDKLFLTYYRDQNDWLYVCGVPQSIVMNAIQDTWLFFFIALFLALGIGIFLAVFFTSRLSSPLARISVLLQNEKSEKPAVSYYDFDKEVEHLLLRNEQMQLELEKQVPSLKTSIFHTLVTGGYQTRGELEENLRKIHITVDSPLYFIIIISLNNLDTGNNLEKTAAQKIFVKNIIEEICHTSQIYDLDFERIALLLDNSYKTIQDAKQGYEVSLADIKEKVEHTSGINISFYGDTASDITLIPSCFKHVRTLMDNDYESFKGVIQWYDEKNLVKKIREQESFDIKQRIRKHIADNYRDPQLSLSSVADNFGISEVYLSRLFKHSFEQNFSKYVEELRMEKAKKLIEENRLTVAQIADSVGYNSPQTFRRAYKRCFGCNPGDKNAFPGEDICTPPQQGES